MAVWAAPVDVLNPPNTPPAVALPVTVGDCVLKPSVITSAPLTSSPENPWFALPVGSRFNS